MPVKNIDNDLEKELVYCKKLERIVEQEPSISSIPAVQEKLNILKETVEDTQENIVLSKDEDAKIGHKSASHSFFGYKTHLAMTEEDKFEYNKDADMFICPAGHIAIRKARQGKKT